MVYWHPMNAPTPREARIALRCMIAAGTTHEEVAVAIGVTARTVSNWAENRNDPRPRDCRAIVAMAKKAGVA